jgi:hypothetical protein
MAQAGQAEAKSLDVVGCAARTWVGFCVTAGYRNGVGESPHLQEAVMSPTTKSSAPLPSREERIEEVMQQLRPKLEQIARRMVERAVDVPEAEEFGAIDNEFRDAGQEVANEVRQAGITSRKKRGILGAA